MGNLIFVEKNFRPKSDYFFKKIVILLTLINNINNLI